MGMHQMHKMNKEMKTEVKQVKNQIKSLKREVMDAKENSRKREESSEEENVSSLKLTAEEIDELLAAQYDLEDENGKLKTQANQTQKLVDTLNADKSKLEERLAQEV